MVGGGTGAFIGAVHRMAARLDDQYVLTAGCFSSRADVNRQSAEALQVAPDRTYATFADMAAAEAGRADGIDVAAIVTPNHLHVEAALAFIRHGIPVLCDKPLAISAAEAAPLAAAVRESGVPFGVTYNYSAYPMARLARTMIAEGALGAIRTIQLQYAQDWLAETLETQGNKQAAWRVDPAKAGPGGSLGDIGTHAAHLAEFVTGLPLEAVAADLSSFGEGRVLDDNAHVLLRFGGGAKGMLWTSQIAHGHANDLSFGVYGERGSLQWRQESPDALLFARHGEPVQHLARGGHGRGSQAATRVPGGHPEGYIEAFATLYREFADQVRAWRADSPDVSLVPTVDEGLAGVRFVEAAFHSATSGGHWINCRV